MTLLFSTVNCSANKFCWGRIKVGGIRAGQNDFTFVYNLRQREFIHVNTCCFVIYLFFLFFLHLEYNSQSCNLHLVDVEQSTIHNCTLKVVLIQSMNYHHYSEITFNPWHGLFSWIVGSVCMCKGEHVFKKGYF